MSQQRRINWTRALPALIIPYLSGFIPLLGDFLPDRTEFYRSPDPSSLPGWSPDFQDHLGPVLHRFCFPGDDRR